MATIRILLILFTAFITSEATAQDSDMIHFSKFGVGRGVSYDGGIYALLDQSETFEQANALAFDVKEAGSFSQVTLHCMLRILAGGDGGSFIFLNTDEYGKNGPAPFLKSWVEPNLAKTFAVGIDVHNPKDDEAFGRGGNYQGLPEREVSLHWDGREIVKRVALEEFRGDFVECEISLQYVVGGAEVTVRIAEQAIYNDYFIAGMFPYESRLAIGAGTREDLSTKFDVMNLTYATSEPAPRQRPPKHFQVFNHVMSNNSATTHTKEVALPSLEWAYGRIILTLEIHDAGQEWHEWDQAGHLYIVNSDGERHDIAPFVTSFRTPAQWRADITHFRPWLAGDVTFVLVAGTSFDNNRGYMMSASLDFYHGVPDLEPFQIIPLWNGTTQYKSMDNHYSHFFTPKTVKFDPSVQAARLLLTTTGHTGVGEFTPAERTVIFLPQQGDVPSAEIRFKNTLWKTDCYLNPVRPQRGTWQYARAGWAPGDIIRPWWIDLSPYIIPEATAELNYRPSPYNFSSLPPEEQPTEEQIDNAIQLVRSYLILYREPQSKTTEPSLKVLAVEENSSAAKAGIQPGDYIQSYNGVQPETIEALRAATKDAEEKSRQNVPVIIYREAFKMTKEIIPGRMGVTVIEQ